MVEIETLTDGYDAKHTLEIEARRKEWAKGAHLSGQPAASDASIAAEDEQSDGPAGVVLLARREGK